MIYYFYAAYVFITTVNVRLRVVKVFVYETFSDEVIEYLLCIKRFLYFPSSDW